jgi:hypothetical protein
MAKAAVPNGGAFKKTKKVGKACKKNSNNKKSKHYKKSYRGQGR